MIKIIGAVLIISAGVINGVRSAKYLKNRVRNLRSIIISVAQIRAELNSRLSSVTDILKGLSVGADETVRSLYKRAYSGVINSDGESFAQIFKKAVEESDELLLDRDERAVLYEIGTVLGRYDVKSQDAILSGIISRLGRLEKEAEDELKTELRLQAGLSVISGVFVVIILL